MATLDAQGRPIITVGDPGVTYLCSDLFQIRTATNGTYDIKRRSDNVVVGNTALRVEEVELVGG